MLASQRDVGERQRDQMLADLAEKDIVRQHIKKLKALFDAYDADRNGTVDAPELSKALETYNFYLTSEQTYYTSAPPAPPRPARAPRRPRPPRAQCSTTSTSTART
jgi:hypothetical protein